MLSSVLGRSVAPILSIVSQGVGVAQLILLLIRVGANDATDAYLYLFNMGMLPTQIIVVGLLFPMLLNRERITKRLATHIRRWTPLAGSAFVVLASCWMWANGRLDPALAPIVVASVVNAFLQACLWIRAVSAEAMGDPNWISGIAIPANALAAFTLLLPLPDEVIVWAMVIALAVGNGALLVVMRVRQVGNVAFDLLPTERALGSRAELWFLTKAGVSYGGLAVIQSLAVLLPPAMLTLLSVAAKIVASLVATFVNAVMPRMVHQTANSIRPSMSFLSWLFAGAGILGALLIAGASLYDPELTLVSVCVSLWILGAISNAVAQRSAYRFLPANASRATITVVPVIAGLTLVAALAPTFQLATLICAYAAVDAVTGAILLWTLRARANAVIASAIAVLILAAGVLSLLLD